MRNNYKLAIVCAVLGFAIAGLLIAGGAGSIPAADPNTAVLVLVNRTMYGTDHGTIAVEIW